MLAGNVSDLSRTRREGGEAESVCVFVKENARFVFCDHASK